MTGMMDHCKERAHKDLGMSQRSQWKRCSRDTGSMGTSRAANVQWWRLCTAQMHLARGLVHHPTLLYTTRALFFFFNLILFIFYTAGSYQLSILYILLYICQSQSPNSSHHDHPPAAFPPWCAYICSLHLCLYFCPANGFICTIFLGSTYMR